MAHTLLKQLQPPSFLYVNNINPTDPWVIYIEKDSESGEFFDEASQHHIPLEISLIDPCTDLPICDHQKRLFLEKKTSSFSIHTPLLLTPNARGTFKVSVSGLAENMGELQFSIPDSDIRCVIYPLNFLSPLTGKFYFYPSHRAEHQGQKVSVPLAIPASIQILVPGPIDEKHLRWSTSSPERAEVDQHGKVTLFSEKIPPIFVQYLNHLFEIDLNEILETASVFSFESDIAMTQKVLMETLTYYPANTSIPTAQELLEFFNYWGQPDQTAYSAALRAPPHLFWVKENASTSELRVFDSLSGQHAPAEKGRSYFSVFSMPFGVHATFFERGEVHHPHPG